jgi:hypothetical protein
MVVMGWENVRSREDAEALRAEGRLTSVQLMPGELGGSATVDNIVYVPPAAGADKEAITAELLVIFRAGHADRLSVVPEYRGDSFVPAALAISAWREGGPPAYERRLAIW